METLLTVEDYRKLLRSQEKQLLIRLEYRYGLNNILMEKEIFTDEEESRLKSCKEDSYTVNKELLQFLITRDEETSYQMFLEALQESLQSHLNRLIIQDGQFSGDERDRPLKEVEFNYLKRNQSKIVDILHTLVDELADVLYQEGCINDYHKQKLQLKSHFTNRDRATEMISIMRNRNLQHFTSFRQILQKKKSLVYYLTDIVNRPSIEVIETIINVKVEHNAKDVSIAEDVSNFEHPNTGDITELKGISMAEDISNIQYISAVEDVPNVIGSNDNVSNNYNYVSYRPAKNEFTSKSAMRFILSLERPKLVEKEVVRRFLALQASIPIHENDHVIIGLKEGHCIRVYVSCPSIESLRRLRESVENGRMATTLENLYNDLLQKNNPYRLQVKRVFMVDFKIQEFYKLCDLGNADVSNNMLDHELLRNGKDGFKNVLNLTTLIETILLNTFCWRVKKNAESSCRSFKILSSVCLGWWKTFRKIDFEEAVRKMCPIKKG